MRWTAQITLLLMLGLSGSAQTPPSLRGGIEIAPLFQISFKSGDPVPGIGAMPAIRLPFECTSDGTVFVTMIQALGSGSPPQNLSPYSPSLLLTSVSLSHEAHSFPLDQVPDLYDVQNIGDYASASKVIFLVRAAHGNKAQQAFTNSGGSTADIAKSTVEHHFYIVMFDRVGNYQKMIQIGDAFHVNLVGQFPSGTFLAYGFDQADHAPKLTMLKEDGSLLKFLEIPKGDAPDSAVGTKDASGKGPAVYVSPAQLVGQGHFIYIVQNNTGFPLLEVSEAGAIRVIKPKLPEGAQIETLVPSDENTYIRVKDISQGAIYELNTQDGSVLRRFRIGKGESGADIACVHDGKFLSFQHSEGRLVPLVGTAEPTTETRTADDVR